MDKEKQKEQKRLERQDASERNAVEGKFGEGKRRYGLARIMARLKETAESVICLQFLVMNLEHRLRVLLPYFRCGACFGLVYPLPDCYHGTVGKIEIGSASPI